METRKQHIPNTFSQPGHKPTIHLRQWNTHMEFSSRLGKEIFKDVNRINDRNRFISPVLKKIK